MTGGLPRRPAGDEARGVRVDWQHIGFDGGYASAGGLEPLIFIPHGNISYGKLAQALEYGAKTFQVEANFDQILALVRVLAERLGIYLLNSINRFALKPEVHCDRDDGSARLAGAGLDRAPGGNLGNVSAFGKGCGNA